MNFFNETGKCVTFSTPHGQCKVCDPCAIVMMTNERPVVQIFDGRGNRTDFGQYNTMSEISSVLDGVLQGKKLTVAKIEQKPLTLNALRNQAADAASWPETKLCELNSENDFWIIGDFEIRRRK